jgi:hypothetical protein
MAEEPEEAVFSLTPATAEGNFLNFALKRDKETYNAAVKKLSDDEFDCVEENLNDFMVLLKARADEFGWSERIMSIPISDEEDLDPKEVSLLTEHASASLEQIRQHEMLYIDEESRERQDMQCLYKCLMSSLSQVGRNKVNTDKHQYILKDQLGRDAYSGNLLLKVILKKSTVDNRSGAFAIRMEMSDLASSIEKVNFDITKFNTRVKTLMHDLSRRGEKSADLHFNLFRAYKTVPVEEFISFINNLKDDEDELGDDERHDENYIMDKAENKFRILEREGTWQVKEKEVDKFLALEAKMDKLIKENKSLKINNKRKRGDRSRNRPTKPKGRTKVEIYRRPKGDVTKPVTINGDKWWWCGTETGGKCTPPALRKHKPSDCKGKQFLKTNKLEKTTIKVQEAAIAPAASSESEE